MESIIFLWVSAALLVSPSLAANYKVGGSQGWELGVNYNTWASGKTFTVGDTLNFQYTSLHTVVEVRKAAYDSCQTSNPLSTHADGNTTLTLSTSGNKYYICGTPGHCSNGMKLAIDVKTATSTAPSPRSGSAPSPSPRSSATPPSSAAPPSNSTRSPGPSSSSTPPSSTSPNGSGAAATSYDVRSVLVLSGAAAVSVLLM